MPSPSLLPAIAGLTLAAAVCAGAAPIAKVAEPVDYVDPIIGRASILLQTAPQMIYLPYGMVQSSPTRTHGLEHQRSLGDYIADFPLGSGGAFAFGVCSGKVGCRPHEYRSTVDHDQEKVRAYRFDAYLETHDIDLSQTVTERAMVFRLKLNKPGACHVIFRTTGDGYIQRSPDGASVEGYQKRGIPCSFYARFSRPFDECGSESATDQAPIAGSPRVDGDAGSMYFTFKSDKPQTIEVRIGFSFIDVAQAKENMTREVAGKTFDEIAERGRRVWNDELNRIRTVGGTERQKRVFYTALYRCLQRMIDVSEYGRYRGIDGKLYNDGGRSFYVDDWTWDTFRSAHPLRTVIDPEREADMMESFARITTQTGGYAPYFPVRDANPKNMIGNHAAPIALDAWEKGIRNFDIATLYNGLRKNETEVTRIPWLFGPMTELDKVYEEKGWFPGKHRDQPEWVPGVGGFECRQSVGVTLDYAYDDWCISRLASELGKSDDERLFGSRAKNYRNMYNPKVGLMCPKDADGNWIECDPKLVGREFYGECNGWITSFAVPHDIAGLMELMGGPEAFVAKLDQMFNESLGTWIGGMAGICPDSTGMIGQFPMGNEPSFNVPYLYIYAGEPAKTARRVRLLMDTWFTDCAIGYPGDEDGGAMSSWYVLSAIGFFPLCPGRPEYGIGSPIFEKSEISLGSKGVFTIIAKGVSKQNKYVQSATLNGKPLKKAWFTHSDLIPGGSLVLNMGPRPSPSWGRAEYGVPTSLSDK